MKIHSLIAFASIVVSLTRAANAQPTVQVGFDSSGLHSVTYGGQEYLGYWHAPLGSVNLLTPGGQTITGSTQFTQQVDITKGKVTQTYNWGTVATTYVRCR